MDYEATAKKWMKDNGIEITPKRVDSLSAIMFEAVNNAYNDGLHNDRFR